MTDDGVVVSDEGPVRTIRLNRPEALNSFDTPMKVALLGALRAAADDPGVRALVLTGTGRAFCAGQDLRALLADREAGVDLSNTVTEHFNPIALALATMPKPVVAAVNGVAAGAGASITFPADLRIVAESAGFNLAFTQVALSADTGASWWLPRLVGVARAKELLLMPRTVDAQEALAIGLASEVVPDDAFADRVARVASRLAAGPTLAYAAVRRAVDYSTSHDLESSLAHESTLMELTGSSADHAAAVRAFVAKQPPVFEGR